MSAWGGISSVQFGLPLMWTEAKKRGFTIQDIVQLMSKNPAKLAKLDNRKGCLRPNFDADFVVWDPLAIFEVDIDKILYKNKLSPYFGWSLQRIDSQVILRFFTISKSFSIFIVLFILFKGLLYEVISCVCKWPNYQ